ncbi:hypothetical protein DdX_05518 [Ditylenchus destructor]|uniref:Uncharacterized protein n=1 Tax=Ditylenchus destructor TaxID=166010 RepID=A0AAD4R6P7_9BILA|nr:hypothetical protein DdX_05518 [Ditylenchus destructor]
MPISADDLKKIGPYPEPNKYPPFWKRLNDIKPYQRHLCGNAIVLRDFEKYTLTYSEFKQSVSKQGIYGIIGDGQHKKVCFFIKVEPAEEGPALAEFKRGFFFRYNDVRSTVVGTTLWLISDYVWTAPVELDGAKWDLEETSYQFVDIKRPTNTGSVKQEPDENAPTPKQNKNRDFLGPIRLPCMYATLVLWRYGTDETFEFLIMPHSEFEAQQVPVRKECKHNIKPVEKPPGALSLTAY